MTKMQNIIETAMCSAYMAPMKIEQYTSKEVWAVQVAALVSICFTSLH